MNMGSIQRLISHWIKQAKPIELPEGGTISAAAFKKFQKENQKLKMKTKF